MKKTVLTILCAAMAVATLAGCTTNSSGDKIPSDISANNDARIVVPTQGSDEVPADGQTDDATVPEESQADLPGGQNQSGFADDQLLTWASTYYEFAKGEKAPVNDTSTYNNGVKVVPSYLCEPVFADANNYKELLIDSGYYTADQLK